MNRSKESKSSLFSLSHSAVSLRTNLFSLKKNFFFYIAWAFSFQNLTSPESGSFSFPAPRSIFLPLQQIMPDSPCPLAALRSCLIPFLSLLSFKGKLGKPSGLRNLHLP